MRWVSMGGQARLRPTGANVHTDTSTLINRLPHLTASSQPVQQADGLLGTPPSPLNQRPQATRLDALQAAADLSLNQGGDKVAPALHRRQRHLLWQGGKKELMKA